MLVHTRVYSWLSVCMRPKTVNFGKPHISGKNSTSVMHSQNSMYVNQVITYKCFKMCVHHANNYMSSLLTILIRLVHMLINEGLHYHCSLLTLLTCENILMGREKCLRRKQHLFKGCIDTMKQIKRIHMAYIYNEA